MNDEYELQQLNPAQRSAVLSDARQQLILAGAGSGKTRVLVQRIAWLLGSQGISPYSILAVTFTNKAAAEMRARIEALTSHSGTGMWIGTFHSLTHRMLRAHWQSAGLTENFQIIDSDDQYRLVKRIIKSFNLDEKNWSPKFGQWFINQQKDEGLRASHVDDCGDIVKKTWVKVYHAYEALCQQNSLVDFAELLLRGHELLLNNADILAHYQQRFQYVLVDEFQDTNAIQFAWIRLLTGDNGHLMVVGDDDQSIYAWRGARIENIQKFSHDYPQAVTIRLEQNYRSTATILDAANSLIRHNPDRLGKELWTEGKKGELIDLYPAFNETDEARFIVSQAQTLVEQGYRRSNIAILYRSNAQSRVLEENFLLAGIPYRIYGGLRFFERAEIKDALAYLRLLNQPNDDPAFERIVNMPPRGIGEKTLMQIRQHARTADISLWQAAQEIITSKAVSGRALNAISQFIQLITTLQQDCESLDLNKQIAYMLEASQLIDHFKQEKGEKAQTRVENLQELVNAAKQFDNEGSAEFSPLQNFLNHVALEAGETQAASHEDCVQLMTLHAAKGLEFPIVFICGMEESLFPHMLSLNDPKRLDEERRLCYVGMTRAMEKLYFSYAQKRYIQGSEKYYSPSRFLREIDADYIHPIRAINRREPAYSPPAQRRQRPSESIIPDGCGFNLGQRVEHTSFGEGTIVSFEGQGEHLRAEVNFDRGGRKILVVRYAKLQAV